MLQGAMRWFKNLPVPKAVLAGLILLILLVLLSPLTLFAALLAFGASLIALIVRARQRRSKGRWPIVAVASLVLILVFGGISNALYGSESVKSTGASGVTNDRGTKEKKDTTREEVQDRITKATQEAPPPKQQVVPDPATNRYNEQVQDYNRQVQEQNRQIEGERKKAERERYVECINSKGACGAPP